MSILKWNSGILGDFITLHRGYDLPSYERVDGSIPIVTSSGINGFHNQAKIKGPGVVTGRYGTIGEVFFIEEDFWPLNTTLYISDFKGSDPKYIAYFLKTFDFNAHNDKSSVPGINRNHLHTVPVKLPPLPIQREIAHILGSLDDKIDLNRRMNTTLESMARALFKSWFVDFDPVRAKAEGRQPEGIDAETAALFPDSFEASELGEIPRGWGVASLSAVLEINPPRKLPQGQMAPYLAMENMPTQSARAIDWISREVGSGTKFTNGDTLVARITPCLENGKTAYVDFLDNEQIGWGSTEYIVFRSKSGLPLEFPYFLARTDEFRGFAIRNMTGTSGRQRVNASAFRDYKIALPSADIASRFGDFARDIFLKMKTNDAEARTLATIRDGLLPRLMSGEVEL